MHDVTADHPPRPEGWEREIYPMASFPLLAVRDIARSASWYRDALGFADVFTLRAHDGTPLLAHLRWARHADLLLTAQRGAAVEPRGEGITLCFGTLRVDELAERARAAGARIVAGPADTPWNTRDVTMLDPDGYRLTLTAPQPGAMEGRGESFDAAMARARDAAGGSGGA
jgi:uncharacterized glyoxalase superfamily protein PhnB